MLEDRDNIGELEVQKPSVLDFYYRKGGKAPNAIMEVAAADTSEDEHTDSKKGGAKTSKFARRMARFMQVGQGNMSVADETSSVSSREGSSFKKVRPQTIVNIQPSYTDPETLEFDDDNLHFSDIPVMSNDGMYDDSDMQRQKNNELQEDEQEEMVLDRAVDYKMVSIMRQQRRPIVADPYKHDTNTLSQIDEEQSMRWTAALPKFGGEDFQQSEIEDSKIYD